MTKSRPSRFLQRRFSCSPSLFLLSMSLSCLAFLASPPSATAFDFIRDTAAIGAAFMTHLSMHEIGHQVVAEEAGADSPQMQFFVRKDGKFYPGLSTCNNLPKESKLPYAAGGESMAGYTFEFSLQSYRQVPTAYNRALMFFSCTDFLWYTLLSNYVSPEEDTYDPNLIRAETGLSKEMLISLVMTKSLLNLYRVYNKDANLIPMLMVDRTNAAFVIRYDF